MVSISKNGCKAPKRHFFMMLPVKIGRGRKWDWAWSERFENRNKRNVFLRFILKEHGFKVVEYISMLKIVFRHFTCISNRSKMGVAGVTVSRWSWAMNFFAVSVAPKAKSGESLGSIGDKK